MDHEREAGDRARQTALSRIERAERSVKLWLAAAGLCEGILVISYIVLADFGDRVHLLVFIAALLVYTTLALGLIALGAYVRQSVLRILQAIDTLGIEAS